MALHKRSSSYYYYYVAAEHTQLTLLLVPCLVTEQLRYPVVPTRLISGRICLVI